MKRMRVVLEKTNSVGLCSWSGVLVGLAPLSYGATITATYVPALCAGPG